MRARPILTRAALGLTLSGCMLSGCIKDDRDYEDSRARGDLGAGEFLYGCFNDTDSACEDSDDPILPRAIAVGGRFDLRFATKSGPLPSVIAPANDYVRPVEGGFQVRAAGLFALLAVNANREVVDIKHLRSAEIDEVRVQEQGELPETTLRLEPRASTQLLAIPYDSRGVPLGGALSYSWSSSDEAQVSVESLAALNRVRVRAGTRPGKAMLRIDIAGKTFSVNVMVGGEPGPAPDDAGSAADAGGADASAPDGGNDAGSDAATGDAQIDGGVS